MGPGHCLSGQQRDAAGDLADVEDGHVLQPRSLRGFPWWASRDGLPVGCLENHREERGKIPGDQVNGLMDCEARADRVPSVVIS
eukprot:Skav208636  [mRNA]  locus=scaffold1081:4849:5100:+ [translate_table: standard]